MNRKGQIITIDFIFSLILFMIALGYVFRIAEANDYTLKEEELFGDLQRIGTASSELLVSSPDFTCEVAMGTTVQHFTHCINETNLATADKAKLGIPNGYDFNILLDGVFVSGTLNPGFAPPNIYSEERTIVSMAGNPTIGEIKRCINGAACPLTEKRIMLKVWK